MQVKERGTQQRKIPLWIDLVTDADGLIQEANYAVARLLSVSEELSLKVHPNRNLDELFWPGAC